MAYVAADSFCSQSDVEAHVGRGQFTPTTKPSQQEVLDFMATRAGQIQAALAAVGYSATPPSGGAAISVASDSGKSLERIARLCNALFAAGDVVASYDTYEDPEGPHPSQAFWAQAEKLLAMMIEFVEETLALGKSSVHWPPERAKEDLIQYTQKW